MQYAKLICNNLITEKKNKIIYATIAYEKNIWYICYELVEKTDFKSIYYKKPEIATLWGSVSFFFLTSPCFFFRKEKK